MTNSTQRTHLTDLARLSTMLVIAILVGLTACGRRLTFVEYTFDLDVCPEYSFALPGSVSEGPYHLRPIVADREHYPPCPGFTLYSFREKMAGRYASQPMGRYVFVRLERGPSCRLHVVIGQVLELHEKDPPRWAEVTARLVVQAVPAQVRVPAASIQLVGSFTEVGEWCRTMTNLDRGRRLPPGPLCYS
jgi:hypothetical protein